MERKFTLKDVLRDSWDLARGNLFILLGFTAVQFASFIIVSMVTNLIFGDVTSTGLVVNIVINLFDAFFSVAFYQVFFKLIDQPGDAEFPDFVPNLVKAVNFLIVKLILGLGIVFIIAISGSLYALVLPDIQLEPESTFSLQMLPLYLFVGIAVILITIRLAFVTCFIVDQDSGSSESISQSWTLTKGHFWFVFTIFLYMLIINILGAMLFFVGLLFSVPFSSIMLIIAYRHLENSYIEEEEILIDDAEEAHGN